MKKNLSGNRLYCKAVWGGEGIGNENEKDKNWNLLHLWDFLPSTKKNVCNLRDT